MQTRCSKLQRWTDLLAALLRRHYPATFEELARDIPAYSDGAKTHAALMRMFERDKDELRAFGIAIETHPIEEGELVGYKLERKGFYLPYLALAGRDGKAATTPKKIPKQWYRSLPSLVFEPDELEIIAAAAARVRTLGDPILTAEADSAMKKLAFDLPMPVRVEEQQQAHDAIGEAQFMSASRPMMQPMMPRSPIADIKIPATRPPERSVFEILNDALTRRKRVAFTYHSMGPDSSTRRSVEPYGLFFLSAHWYLAANDLDKHDIRNFRLNRISEIELNKVRAQSGDYEIPSTFVLREHARSRQAWELGDGAGAEAIVDFNSSTGPAQAAAKLGVAVEGGINRRKFRIRRLDSFARWLLSFAGELTPREPDALVDEYTRQVNATRAVYENDPHAR